MGKDNFESYVKCAHTVCEYATWLYFSASFALLGDGDIKSFFMEATGSSTCILEIHNIVVIYPNDVKGAFKVGSRSQRVAFG